MRASTSIVLGAILSFAPLILALPSDSHLQRRADACQSGYTICAPSGATTTSVPKIGDASFRQLFTDLVETNLPGGNSKVRRDELEATFDSLVTRDSASLCCQDSTLCYSMASLSIPFCYDKFTTNFFLPDSSYGTLYFGTYKSSSGDTANLITGNYTLKSSGETGNIYSTNESEKPNTATMSVPNQFTGTGIGSAIPATALGAYATVTITSIVKATTIQATTLSASLSVVTQTSGTTAVVATSTIPASTIQATTEAESTVVTTATVAAGSASVIVSAAAAATSKSSAEGEVQRLERKWVVGGILMGVAFVL